MVLNNDRRKRTFRLDPQVRDKKHRKITIIVPLPRSTQSGLVVVDFIADTVIYEGGIARAVSEVRVR